MWVESEEAMEKDFWLAIRDSGKLSDHSGEGRTMKEKLEGTPEHK